MKIDFFKIFIFLLTILMALNTALSYSQEKSDTIYWEQGRLLGYEDFKGKVDTLTDFAALSYISVGYSASYKYGDFTYKTHCYFTKSKSWAISRHFNEKILAHEQGHFNIGELYRRKLEDELKEYRPREGFIKADLHDIYKRINDEKIVLEKEYDSDCRFPVDPRKQKMWTEKILNMLNAKDSDVSKNK